MAPEHRPVATGFFPLARLSLFVGAAFAAVGAYGWRAFEEERRAEALALAQAELDVAAAAPAASLSLPLRGPVVAHVWLENCADCMTAFEAHARIVREGSLRDVPQVNVAYGDSTPAFRAKYLVDANLLVDADGAAVVRPFGIGSFTTLVLDAGGAVVLRDRPDQPGYVERVRAAWAQAQRR